MMTNNATTFDPGELLQSWAYQFGRSNYSAADEDASDLIRSGIPVWAYTGLIMRAYDAFFRGELITADRSLTEAQRHYSDELEPGLVNIPAYPPAALQGVQMLVKYYLGDPRAADTARDRMFQAIRALSPDGGEALPPPLRNVFRDYLLTGAHAFNSLLLTLRRDFAGVLREVASERAIIDRVSTKTDSEMVFATYHAMVSLYESYATWIEGGRRNTESTIRTYERRLDVYEATGTSGLSYFLVPLAEMHLAVGNTASALACVRRALDHADHPDHREHVYYSDVRGVHAQALFREDAERSIEEFKRALHAAREIQSDPAALRVAIRWYETDSTSGEAPLREALARAQGKVSDGELAAAEAVVEQPRV